MKTLLLTYVLVVAAGAGYLALTIYKTWQPLFKALEGIQ